MVVFVILDMVFQMLYLKRDEGYHLLAQTHVQQVVAQREVEQLALPERLLGDGLPSLFEPQVIVAQLFHLRRDVLMLQAFVLNYPCAVLHDALRQWPDIRKPAAMDIDEVEEIALVVELLHGSLHGILETDGCRRGDTGGLQEHKVVDAVGSLFLEVADVVADHLWEYRRREPCAHHGVPLELQDDGEDAYRL